MDTSVIDITTTVRGTDKVPRIPFGEIAQTILGKNFELSLVICGDTLARRMNREHRKKTYAPNILSFPLSRREGEIFLNVRCAEREARRYHMPLRERLAYLFVHGCFHLKGLDHGDRMEQEEQRVMKDLKLG